MEKKTVLITGGSSGIGYEMSRLFGRAGFRLLWVSWSEEELSEARSRLEQEISGVYIRTLCQDLSVLEGAQYVYDWVKQMGEEVDVLINNAGFGTYGYVWETDSAKEVAMIQLNVLNVYRMTRLFLADMVKVDAGVIINISSNSSFQPVPRMATYASTKAFVTHFSRGLSEELKVVRSKVRVITVCPSAIKDTPFKDHADMADVKTFSGLAYTTAEEVASDVWRAYSKAGKDFMVTGWKMRFLYAISGWVPYRLQQFLVRNETKRSR